MSKLSANFSPENKVLILDFGSQVTKLIARRVRELGVYCEIFNHNTNIEKIINFAPKAIILSGGPSSVKDSNALLTSKQIFDLNIPILGICYGQQLICKLLGGEVAKANVREFGKADLTINFENNLFKNIPDKTSQIWMSHGDVVTKLPQGFVVIAQTKDAPYAAIANNDKKIYGVQFHPEVTHTTYGGQILQNFICDIANISANWNMKNYKNVAVENIRLQVKDKKVICGISGGVDSSVTAALIAKAIGKNLTGVFVDTGLLRKNEAEQVKEMFEEHFDINFVFVDAKDKFLNALDKVSDPEQKRKIIGKLFIDIFEAEAKKIKDVEFLAQGTLYPDVIESGNIKNGVGEVIKSHHNVGGLPEKMQLKLVEPLRELFKDEVRALGEELGMNHDIIYRHPFPGPGLAIRIPGAITAAKVALLQNADDLYIKEIKKAGLYDKIWQAFAVLLPVKTVGVMGDGKTYEYAIALRAVTALDGMTADYYPFSHDFLGQVATKIINQVRGVNRVTYDITSKPPGTIEWE
jgi:GMP synthase (glutamine-hydrolysing)